MLKFVDGSIVEAKQFYMNIIKSQLTSAELLLLLYYFGEDNENPDAKRLITEYEILKGLPKDKFKNKEDTDLYDPKAYGD